MTDGVRARLNSLSDNYLALSLFLALFILTLLGVGDVRIVSLLGLVLCAEGLAQAQALAESRVDWWILGPLLVYNLLSAASAQMVLGSVAEGYAGCQLIWPVLYLLLLCLTAWQQVWLRRLCVGLAGLAAAAGLASFAWAAAFTDSARRLSGLLGNPNAFGIFLVLGWLAWQDCQPEGKAKRWWCALEMILLTALALTLSMGSFLAMAMGILCLTLGRKNDRALYLTQLLAKAALGMGCGLLLYLTAARSGQSWFCLPLLLYILVWTASWRDFLAFLAAKPKAAAMIAICGGLTALGMVWARPSAAATFAERLHMMHNGLGYLWQKPLLGVGPYQWRGLNLLDADKFFNTWHIHNVFIHVGVELGLLAMVLLAVWLLRLLLRPQRLAARAGVAAFLCHNLLDTSFFYLGVTALVLLTAAEPLSQAKDRPVGGVLAYRLLFGLLALVFAWDLYCFGV